MFAPPPPPKKIFSLGGGGATAPQLPQDRRLWGQATWTSKGGCVQWRIQDLQKKGVGGKIRARSAPCVCAKRAPHTGGVQGPAVGPPGGVQGQSPCRGPRGQSPRKLSSFQQIRAFKMVVRSDRKCNFSRCNFAYRALVGGRGCGSHQIFRSS